MTYAALILLVPLLSSFVSKDRTPLAQGGCLSCHSGIMPFAEGKMMKKIRERGKELGDPEGCVVCHGGTPSAITKEKAHNSSPQTSGPKRFYPNPGNLFVAQYTCGQCHEGYAQRLIKSSTGTKAGEIQRNLCIFALKKKESGGSDPESGFGEYEIVDADGPVPSTGSKAYKEFMSSLSVNPGLFTAELRPPPFPVDNMTQDEESRCEACHYPRIRIKLEDQHGTGCASCHVPYRRDGSYLGADPTIDKSQPGKLLLHRLQGTGNTKIEFPGMAEANEAGQESFHGILVDNCFICHNDVRQEELNPIGSVISHYGSFHQTGAGGAMLCQDCHTSTEMHGDGNIPLSSKAQIEVRCEDCHGTVDKAPWELPLGYDGPGRNRKMEPQERVVTASPRGLTMEPPGLVGQEYDVRDGYLLTSRGNPFGNVVKDGEKVMLYSATGKQFLVPILKQIKQNKSWKSQLSQQAMFQAREHGEKMKCMSCHGDRVQTPCFGCHSPAGNPN